MVDAENTGSAVHNQHILRSAFLHFCRGHVLPRIVPLLLAGAFVMSDLILKNTIKVERAKKDLTQEGLANLVGVTRKTINSIERGNYVPSTLLRSRSPASSARGSRTCSSWRGSRALRVRIVCRAMSGPALAPAAAHAHIAGVIHRHHPRRSPHASGGGSIGEIRARLRLSRISCGR